MIIFLLLFIKAFKKFHHYLEFVSNMIDYLTLSKEYTFGRLSNLVVSKFLCFVVKHFGQVN